MATLEEYFEKDFASYLRVHIRLHFRDELIEGAILYDFPGQNALIICYIRGQDKNVNFF